MYIYFWCNALNALYALDKLKETAKDGAWEIGTALSHLNELVCIPFVGVLRMYLYLGVCMYFVELTLLFCVKWFGWNCKIYLFIARHAW